MVSSVSFLIVLWACVSLVALFVLVACSGLWGFCLVVLLGSRTWVLLFDWLFVFVVPACGYFIRFILVSGCCHFPPI